MATVKETKSIQVKILVTKSMARDWRRKARLRGVSVGELVRGAVAKERV